MYFTGDDRIDSLLFSSEPHWNGPGVFNAPASVTFSFAQFGTPEGLDNDGQAPFTAQQAAAARLALQAWSDVANIDFTEVTDLGIFAGDSFTRGDINFINEKIIDDDPTLLTLAYAFIPFSADPKGTERAGDLHVNDIDENFDSLAPGGQAFLVLMHELGHALGLNHPTDGSVTLPDNEVNDRFTVMAPFIDENVFAAQGVFAETPMPYDILAIQHLYGQNKAHNAGNTTYTFDDHQLIYETIWDGGGNDTIDASASDRRAIINLKQGSYSSIGTSPSGLGEDAVDNLAIAFDVNIENARGGAGSDSIGGNGVANKLVGNAGLDALSGLGGDDRLEGGKDNDRLAGGEGNDLLIGGSGADVMIGGDGDDRYKVDNRGDVVLDNGTGTDTVVSTVNFSLTAKIETLLLTGTADIDGTGTNGGNRIVGNRGDNTLTGNRGNDTLDGGSGDDVLIGGPGRDKLVGSTGDDRFAYTEEGDGTFVAANVVRGGADGDRVIGFVSGDDKFRFDDTAFDPAGDVGTGLLTLGDDFSVIGVAYDGTNPGANANHAAGEASFIFSTADSTLYYDADGAGAGYTVVARIIDGTDVAATDISIV
ncbi:MAG: M10 family metallopeptidase [Alphaproteobacteria bacterium]